MPFERRETQLCHFLAFSAQTCDSVSMNIRTESVREFAGLFAARNRATLHGEFSEHEPNLHALGGAPFQVSAPPIRKVARNSVLAEVEVLMVLNQSNLLVLRSVRKKFSTRR